MTPSLRITRLEVRRGRVPVIDGLSAEIAPGRICWVIGENGIGKSSFLGALTGRVPVHGGRLRLGDRPLRPSDTAGYHPRMAPPPGGTLSDLLGLGAALGVPIAADGLLSWNLRGSQRLERLSTGQAKRSVLALLLRSEAPVLVLDEPFDHLSAAGREGLLDRLRILARRRIVLVGTNLGVSAGDPHPQVIDFDADGMVAT
jgi:ABC-type multidrug transport system ATPase subunit